MNILEVDKIQKYFSQDKDRLHVLNDVSFKVKEGEFLSIVGPSGCGKTTLLKILIGLLKQDAGKVVINGKENLGNKSLMHMVFQDLALFPWATVVKNIEFPLELRGKGKEEIGKTVKEKIMLAGLKGFEKYYPHQLSGGMKQRVALARALVCNPKILLLDEPLASLDAQTRELFQEELLALLKKTGATTLLVTHSIEEACFLSDRVVLLTKRSASVKEIIEIKVGERNGDLRSDSKFFQIVNGIKKLMKEEALNNG